MAMSRIMKYCVDTPNRGLTLNPDESSDGNKDFEFTIMGIADSSYATCPDMRRSVSGWTVFSLRLTGNYEIGYAENCCFICY